MKIAERLVKPLGVVYLYNQIYHMDPRLEGNRVELWETLKGLEIRKGRKVYHLIGDYWEKRKKRSS